MQDKYFITLAAGTRVNGVQRIGSTIEEQMHIESLAWLKNKLGINFLDYNSSTGFITAILTDEEADMLVQDYRVYRVSKITIPTLCSQKFTTYDTTGLWHLSLLSNNTYSEPNRPLIGFSLQLVSTRYGVYPNDYYDMPTIVRLISPDNKFIKDGKLYDLSYKFNFTHMDIISLLAVYGQRHEGRYYIVYNTQTYAYELQLTIGNNLAIGEVNVQLCTNSIMRYYSNLEFPYEFTNLVMYVNNNTYIQPLDGNDVEIIIGDTHIDYDLDEFEGRASLLYNPYTTFTDAYFGELDTGRASHGTLVACAAAGKTYGVAKKASIKGVTLFDYSEGENPDGSSVSPSDKVHTGIFYIADYIAAQKFINPNKSIVVNFSFNYGSTVAEIDDTISAMVEDGAVVVIAAGNSNVMAATSPYADSAIMVAACNENLEASSFTNYGSRITVYAPGENIKGLMNGGAIHTWSGTSVAAPIVAGVCAVYLSLYNNAIPQDIKNALIANSLPAITYNKLYTVNKLIQNIDYGYVSQIPITINHLKDLILTLAPYVTNIDNTVSYGNKLEITLDNISNLVISAGTTESIDLGTVFTLQR